MSIDTPTDQLVTDERRLAALRRVALLDTPSEEAFDRLTRLASLILDVPVALVSLVDADRQFFKSCVGLPEPWATVRETPLSHSFCQHTVVGGAPLVIEDAREHPLVRDNLAIPDLNVIAYAGIPLTTSDGHVLGSFCAIDGRPRVWSERDLAVLTELAGSAMTIIEMRASAAQLDDARRERRELGDRLRATEARVEAANQRRVVDMLDVSERLQRGLLPGRFHLRGDTEVLSFYRPGARTLLLGGDFFDVLEHDDEVHFILADVAGHGPDAAALAVALRASWAALYQPSIPPLTAVERLNGMVLRERQDDSTFVTALAGAFHAPTRTLRLVSAGHPPPLLLGAASADPIDVRPGVPLGFRDDGPWPVTTVTVPPGAAVMAFTDGLYEGRRAPGGRERLGHTGLAELAARHVAAHGVDRRLADGLYATATALAGDRLEDDVAILVLQPGGRVAASA